MICKAHNDESVLRKLDTGLIEGKVGQREIALGLTNELV